MLQEALDELFGGQNASFELSGVGSAILERDLSGFQTTLGERKQAAIAECNTMDIGGQVFESSLAIRLIFLS